MYTLIILFYIFSSSGVYSHSAITSQKFTRLTKQECIDTRNFIKNNNDDERINIQGFCIQEGVFGK